MLASGGFDHVWDANSGQPIGAFSLGDDVSIQALQFNKDGTLLASGGEDGSIRLWESSLAQWKTHASSIARRELTAEERREYVATAHESQG
jgi:WD40 repeat protein